MDINLDVLQPYVEHPVTIAAAVLLFAALVAKLVDWVVSGMLSRWATRTETDLDDRIVKILHGPTVNTVNLLGVVVAIDVLDMSTSVETPLIRMALTIILILWATFVLRASSMALLSASEHPDRFAHVVDTTFPIFNNALRLIIVGLAAYVFIVIWDIDATGWLASAGILGIAVGFAAKDTLSNLFAGVFIIADAPYKVGDMIHLETGERGAVTYIGIRSTRIITRDDIQITIPNAILGNSKVINESRPDTLQRIRVSVGVAYGSDVDRVKEILLEVATQSEGILSYPAPTARFRAFGDSSLDFELRCHVNNPRDRTLVEDLLNTGIYKAFKKEEIEIPFPQTDLHVRSRV